jgi:hypothetical protein
MNKLTPGSNLRWQSSRMMLTEHVEAILHHNRTKNHRERVELDDQELQIITTALQQSMHTKQAVTLTMFDLVEDLQIVGIVERLDSRLRRLIVEAAAGSTVTFSAVVKNQEIAAQA